MDFNAFYVQSGNFYYQGNTMYIEVGPGRVHPRLPYHKLVRRLSRSAYSQDSPGHFYEAQLLHHGMTPTKNKFSAKKRLREMIANEDLTVPPFVAQRESELRGAYLQHLRRDHGAQG